jgi:hypothetical protein
MFGLNVSVLKIVGIAVAVVMAVGFGFRQGQKSVQAKWDAERVVQTQQYAKAINAQLQKVQQLNESVAKINGEKNAQIENLKRSVAALDDRVRKFPKRSVVPSAGKASSDSKAEPQCDKPILYSEDAGFLAGEAERAEQLRIELLACYKQYDAVR